MAEIALTDTDTLNLENQVKAQAKLIADIQERLKALEADEDTHYPQDTYALISLNSPDKENAVLSFFIFGVAIWAFQMLFIVLLTVSVFTSFYTTEDYNRGDRVMEITEFAAIAGYALIPDASIQDVVTAHQLFPHRNGTENVLGRKISSVLRWIQGASACVCVLFLINVSPNAIDIILNFAALNFVSDMDNVAFELASRGVFGKPLRKECERIMVLELPDTVGDKTNPYRRAMIITLVSMTVVNALLMSFPDFTERLYTSYSGP